MLQISCILLLTLSALQPQSSTAQALQEEVELPDYDTVNQMFKRAAASPGEGGATGAGSESGSGSACPDEGETSNQLIKCQNNGVLGRRWVTCMPPLPPAPTQLIFDLPTKNLWLVDLDLKRIPWFKIN